MSKKEHKITISGYYGFNNCGDEAVLLAVVHCLKKLEPGVEITVFSNTPAATRSMYGVKAAHRWNPFSMLYSIITCDLFISGGGSLFQDVTSSRNLVYYLAVIKAALFFRKKVMIYSQGIGPLNNEKNRAKTLKVLNRCDAVTVRDSISAGFLKELNPELDVHIVSDPVMAFDRQDIDVEKETGGLLRESGVPAGSGESRKPLLLVSMRLWKDDAFFAPVAKLLDSQIENGWAVLLVPAHYPADKGAVDKLMGLMDEKPYSIDKLLTARQFIALAACADKVFSMRLHGLICAVAMGVPILALSYDPKVDGFMEQAGLGRYCLSYDDFDFKTANDLLAEPDAETGDGEILRDAAWEAARIAVELLQK